jgi:toxin CcdB
MAQFDVYENTNKDTCEVFPFLLDVQSEILNELPTRVVVPLALSTELSKSIPVLTPSFKINESEVRMVTPQLVGVHTHLLGTRICSLKDQRSEIIAALDLLFTGF